MGTLGSVLKPNNLIKTKKVPQKMVRLFNNLNNKYMYHISFYIREISSRIIEDLQLQIHEMKFEN